MSIISDLFFLQLKGILAAKTLSTPALYDFFIFNNSIFANTVALQNVLKDCASYCIW